MGLKTVNYEIKEMGITLPSAYAQLTSVSSDGDGEAFGVFTVQRTREDIGTKTALQSVSVSAKIDKSQPVYAQLYEKAKEVYFADWNDAIEDEVNSDAED